MHALLTFSLLWFCHMHVHHITTFHIKCGTVWVTVVGYSTATSFKTENNKRKNCFLLCFQPSEKLWYVKLLLSTNAEFKVIIISLHYLYGTQRLTSSLSTQQERWMHDKNVTVYLQNIYHAENIRPKSWPKISLLPVLFFMVTVS